jgi:hypothetical protein
LRGEGAEDRRSEAGEGQPLSQSVQDRQQHAFTVRQNIVVPKSHDAIAFGCEIRIAPNVGRILRVLSAIDFNDQIFLAAHEVDDERANRLLPHKLVSAQPPVAQSEPELSFGVSLLTAKTSLNADFPAVRTSHLACPSPASRPSAVRHPLPASRGEGKKSARRQHQKG